MKPFLLATVLAVGSASLATAETAEGTYAQTHPRIHEVNGRLHTQNARIDAALATGKITTEQATALHAEDATVRSIESKDKSLDDGHLTKVDQTALNQQLNTISAAIGPGDHPRIAEVNGRLQTQTNRIDRAETNGKITAQQATALHAADTQVAAAETTDEAADKGSLTKVAQRALNQLLNKVSAAITGDTHPRIAEVDARLQKQDVRITRDENLGKITATDATTLHAADQAIQSQEQFAATEDDGHITKAEQRTLNQDLNGVSQQIGSDAGTTGTHGTANSNGGRGSHGGSHK